MVNSWWMWARIIYSLPLAITGLIYVYKPQGAVESLTSFIPGELNLIYAAGFLWIILGLMIAANIQVKFASWGVIGLLAAYQIMVHVPAVYTGDYLNVVWFELLRDVSLAGGALFILASLRKEETSDELVEEWRVSLE